HLKERKKSKSKRDRPAIPLREIKTLDESAMYLTYLTDEGVQSVLLPDEDNNIWMPKEGWPSKLYLSRPGHKILTEEQLKQEEFESEIKRLREENKKMKEDIEKLKPKVDESWKLKGNIPTFRNFKSTCHDKRIPSKEINSANFKQWKSTGNIDSFQREESRSSSTASSGYNRPSDHFECANNRRNNYHPYSKNSDGYSWSKGDFYDDDY
uniref:Uncharacterized protein n=1 Tax=Clytia hemisphaerica TaxID=252671 RepID=A0A7M5XL55_9CNID